MARWTDVRPWPAACAVVLVAMLASAMPAAAADSPLDLGRKALKAGKLDLAISALNIGLTNGSLKGSDIAKAYYVRGLVNAKAGNPAAAISDFNNALYLKGLSDSERKEAEAAKAAAYRAAGVANAPATAEAKSAAPAPAPMVQQSVAAATAPAAKPATVASAPAIGNTDQLPWHGTAETDAKPTTIAVLPRPAAAAVAPPPAPPPVVAEAPAPAAGTTDNPFTSMLGGLFGAQAPQPAAAAPTTVQPIADATKTVSVVAAEPAAETASPAPATTGWKTASATAKPAAIAAAAPATGGVFLQVASLRTTGEAEALASKLSSEHAATLGGVAPSVTPVVLGNMGTFYSVRLGPVASKSAGTGLCAKLRKEGVDCYLATP